MKFPLEESYNRLKSRAGDFEAVADKNTHKTISLALQLTYASLMVSADFLLLLEADYEDYVKRQQAIVQGNAQNFQQLLAMMASLIVPSHVNDLFDSGVLLSEGKDAEALKHAALKAIETAVAIGVKISGAQLVKDAVDVLETLRDLAATGQALKLRKKEASFGSDLLRWADAVKVGAMVWCYQVQLSLLGMAGKGSMTEDEVWDMVIARMVEASKKWDPK